MNFAAIQKKLGKYETNEETSPLSVALQQIISEYGLEIFNDEKTLISQINKAKLSQKNKSQFALVMKCSDFSSFVLNSKADLNMVDIDNIVRNVIQSTGLSYDSVIVIIADTFYACGIRVSIESGPVLSDNTIKTELHAILPSASAKREIKKATELYESCRRRNSAKQSPDEEDEIEQSKVDSLLKIIRHLCASGVSDGFYLLGRCYLDGICNTEKNSQTAFKLFRTAAEMGNAAAASYLGDLYYKSVDFLERDYTLAHYYYTRPGALSIGIERRQALQDIYDQKNANRTTFLFSFITVILTVFFVCFFHSGIFSGSGRLVIGIITSILSFTAFVLAFLYHKHKPFNGIRWLLVVQYFILALYYFILVLA